MQDKMERLLNQIGMNKDYLENASIDKIIVYEKNNLWEFIISNDKVLPVYIYDELCNKIMNTFKTIKDINVVITTNNNSNEYLEDYLEKLIPKDEIYKFGRTYHFNAIALNKTGLKNLFKIISLANTTYLYKTPRILRSKLNELREGLIIGSIINNSKFSTI
jgi:DNA polymerase III alpha subunit (gram-positive type)